jgi:outer membrane protein TolC
MTGQLLKQSTTNSHFGGFRGFLFSLLFLLWGLAGLGFSFPLWGQGGFQGGAVPAVLSAIEENNTTLKALRETVEAQKLGNRTGIYLPDPEASFNYLWGKPGNIGNRTDFSVTQTFDVPAVTGMKARTARRQNILLDLQYQSDRLAILTEARQYCNEIIYRNALLKELSTRLQHARTIADSYRERLDRGDATVLEHNRALLNLTTAQGEITRVEVERAALLDELQRLNGGGALPLDDDRYDEQSLPVDFDAWFAQVEQRHPALAYAQQQVALRKQEIALQRALSLPSLSAGYMSERVTGETFQGVSLGLSIPLWGNKNRVKQAKVAHSAADRQQTDNRLQLYAQLQAACRRAAALKTLADDYRRTLAALNSVSLLKKALDAGEISLPDYLVELGLYYAAIDNALEAERDYRQALLRIFSIFTPINT